MCKGDEVRWWVWGVNVVLYAVGSGELSTSTNMSKYIEWDLYESIDLEV